MAQAPPAPLMAARTESVPVPMKTTSTPVPVMDGSGHTDPVPVNDSVPEPDTEQAILSVGPWVADAERLDGLRCPAARYWRTSNASYVRRSEGETPKIALADSEGVKRWLS